MALIDSLYPPRHVRDGALCIRAAIREDCPLSHEYAGPPLTPSERRWWYVELMLEELAALAPDSGKAMAGDSYEVDDVARAEDGLIATIYGTRTRWSPHAVPFVVTQHPYILGEV